MHSTSAIFVNELGNGIQFFLNFLAVSQDELLSEFTLCLAVEIHVWIALRQLENSDRSASTLAVSKAR